MYVSFSSLGLKKIKNNRFYIIWAIKNTEKVYCTKKTYASQCIFESHSSYTQHKMTRKIL